MMMQQVWRRKTVKLARHGDESRAPTEMGISAGIMMAFQI